LFLNLELKIVDNVSLLIYFTIDLKLNSSADLEIQIINSLGQIMKSYNYGNSSVHQISLNLQDESAGMYFVKLNFGNETIIRKVVKQ
jgi:hypothetical protein